MTGISLSEISDKARDFFEGRLASVNKSLVLPKVLYFLHYGAISWFVPFLGIYLRTAGLGDGEIGVLYAIKPFFFMVSMPFWGYVADYSGKHKLILMALMAIAPLLRLTLLGLEGVWTVSIIVLISDFFGSPVEPILDSTCLDVLPEPILYGKQRLWGAIGWGWVGAPIAGAVLAGPGGIPALFTGHALIAAITIYFVSKSKVNAHPPEGGSVWDVAGVVARDIPTFLFFLASLVIGAGFGVIFAYQFLLLNDLGDNGVIMGIATMCTCLTEVPVLYMSEHVIKPLGMVKSMELSILLATARLLWYGTMTTAAQTLYVEWTHGVTFGLAWAAGTGFCRSIAPEGMGATMQGFYTAWMWGIGVGGGCLVGSYIATTRDVPTIFSVFGYANLTCLVLVGAAHALGMLKEPEHGDGPSASRRGETSKPGSGYVEFDDIVGLPGGVEKSRGGGDKGEEKDLVVNIEDGDCKSSGGVLQTLPKVCEKGDGHMLPAMGDDVDDGRNEEDRRSPSEVGAEPGGGVAKRGSKEGGSGNLQERGFAEDSVSFPGNDGSSAAIGAYR